MPPAIACGTHAAFYILRRFPQALSRKLPQNTENNSFPTPDQHVPLSDSTKTHLTTLTIGTIVVLGALFLPNDVSDSKAFSNLDHVVGPAISERPRVTSLDTPTALAAPPEHWHEVEVRSGDSLARIFSREDLRARDLHDLLQSDEATRRLRRIHPGEQLQYRVDKTGRLLALRYEFDRLESMISERADGRASFTTRILTRVPERRVVSAHASIDSSLFLASTAAGLDDATAMKLADIFQWDVDFVLDIRSGDGFDVVLEELWLDGERLGFGNILAAAFRNRGEVFKAVRYTDSDGYTSYYAPDGRSMRKAFLRAPVQFSRISSNFNMRRRHPLHNTIRPHRGIDYAAPLGTPVVAAGEGRVISIVRNHNASGNYLVLQHGETYQTKYLHLSRFARGLRKGERVDQGEVIGYVGSTGWATGPHLHYEFLVHGVHKNPRTVDLPKAQPIDAEERPRFAAVTGQFMALLDQTDGAQIALAVGGDTTGS